MTGTQSSCRGVDKMRLEVGEKPKDPQACEMFKELRGLCHTK